MTIALIIVIVMCSPIILGPLIIPAIKRGKQDEVMRNIMIYLPLGVSVSEKMGLLTARTCQVQEYAAASLVECGGDLHELWESYEDKDEVVTVHLATFCPLCGKLDKHTDLSVVLGERFSRSKRTPQLTFGLTEEVHRQMKLMDGKTNIG